MDELQFFDPRQDFAVAWRNLPHWSQAGVVCFITWRTADSLPKSAIAELGRERAEILRQFGIEGAEAEAILGENRVHSRFSPRIEQQLARLDPRDRAQLKWKLFTAWDRRLDSAAGACLLARPDLSLIVADSLHQFDSDRYVLTDFVVMPNHVHLLAALADADQLLAQVASWKRFTARRINAALGRRGEFWQVEQFDHLVRSLEQFEYLRNYVADNPRKARLAAGSFRCYSKVFG